MYYIICGKTGNIKCKTDFIFGIPSVWEAAKGEDYWTKVNGEG